MNTLLLWDIDGTLMTSGDAGMHALEEGLQTAFGIEGSLADIDYAGRTDRWIARQIFAKFQLEASETHFSRLFEAYLSALPGQLGRHGARAMAGVAALVAEAADRPGITQGLLTGNLRRGAEAKLGSAGLWLYFPFGAFADDSEHRNDLGPFALSRAAAHHRREFLPDRVFVIGDTPHDIACGRAFGGRTLAVATGRYSVAALAEHRPTAVLPDFTDRSAFWRLIETVH